MKVKILILFVFLALPSYAQIKEDMALTLNDCLRIAVDNNHDYKQSLLNKEKADEQVWEAYGTSLFPKISGSINYNRTFEKPVFVFEMNGIPNTMVLGADNSLTASVTFEQPLFTGAMFLAVNIAKTYAEIANQLLQYSETDLIMQVKEGYYTYLLANEFVQLAELQLNRADENLKSAKSFYEAGLIAEYDYIKANVQYQNSIPALTESKNQASLAKNNLRLLLGLEQGAEFSIIGSLQLKDAALDAAAVTVNDVMNRNNLVRQKELETELQGLVAKYEFTKHLPELAAFGNWQAQAQENDTKSFNRWAYPNSYSVGLSLKIPIFNGFSINSKVQQAEIDLMKSEEGLSKIKKEISNALENVVLQIKKSEEQIAAYKVAVEQAERGYDISVKRFNSGLGTQLEVTNSLVELTGTKVNYLQSIHQYYVYSARLDQLLGKKLNDSLK